MAQIGFLVLAAFVSADVLQAVSSVVRLGALYAVSSMGGSAAVDWALGLGLPIAVSLVFAVFLGWIALVATKHPPSWARMFPLSVVAAVAFAVARITSVAVGFGQSLFVSRLAMNGQLDVEAYYMAQSSGWMAAQVIQGIGITVALVVFGFRASSMAVDRNRSAPSH